MLLEAESLCMMYDEETKEAFYALQDVNLKVQKEEMIGVIGPSGSGKSTLLYLLAGFKEPTSGTVFYKGQDMSLFTINQRAALRRNEFGFIFQRHFLIEYLSLLDNILLVAKDKGTKVREKALQLMDFLEISHLVHKKPYQTSVGQRQRCAIARALINDPTVIFADEPTASMDHKNAKGVMDLLHTCREKMAVILVTHDRSILQNADRVIEVWEGRIKDNHHIIPINKGIYEKNT